MYRLLIAEDEDFVREAFVRNIDWNAIGFTVMDAPDGEIALQIAKEFRPDALLTDIRMPFIDGLELVERLRADDPNLPVVVISGHDEFEFAQRALKRGVRDYLLKPVRPHVLEKAMRDVKDALDERARKDEKLQKLRALYRQSIPLLQEQFLARIAEHPSKLSETAIRNTLDELQIPLRGTAYIVCVFSASTAPDLPPSIPDAHLLDFALHNVLAEEFGTDARCLRDSRGQHVAIYCKRSREQSERLFVYDCVEAVKQSAEMALTVVLTVGIGQQVEDLAGLSVSYQSAIDALSQQVLLGKGRIYDAADYAYSPPPLTLPFGLIDDLLTAIKIEDAAAVQRALDELFSEIKARNSPDLNAMRLILAEVIGGAQKLLMEADCLDAQRMSQLYQALYTHDTMESLHILLAGALAEMKKALDDKRKSTSAALIDRACHVAAQMYTDADLSLRSVAEQVYVTPSYLSTLFKRELGTSFVEYITKLRMEKAKELLSTGEHKTYEVAALIGYSDPQYFSSRFKRYTGETPTTFRKGKGVGGIDEA